MIRKYSVKNLKWYNKITHANQVSFVNLINTLRFPGLLFQKYRKEEVDMKRLSYAVSIAILVSAFVLMFPIAGYASDDVPRITVEELRDMLDKPGLAILDARIVKDWRKTDSKIKSAVRIDPHDVSSWAPNYAKDQKIVVYCAWKNEYTSASVAGRLIELGYSNVSALKGGWLEWIKKGLPTEPK